MIVDSLLHLLHRDDHVGHRLELAPVGEESLHARQGGLNTCARGVVKPRMIQRCEYDSIIVF